MAKIRIHELAKELEKQSKDILSFLQEKGVEIRGSLNRKPTALRWAVWYALILFILIFGAYGVGYIPVDPMYANF